MRTKTSYAAFIIFLATFYGLTLFASDTTDLPEPTVAVGAASPDPSCELIQKEIDTILLEIELQQQRNEALRKRNKALLLGIEILEQGIETLEQGRGFFDSPRSI